MYAIAQSMFLKPPCTATGSLIKIVSCLHQLSVVFQALAEQQRAEGQAAEQSLQEELDKRDAVILQIQEELRQKDMLLQQISMAAAPDPPAVPSPAKRKVATPARPARVPRPTPPRFVDAPQKGRSPTAFMVSTAPTALLSLPCYFYAHFLANINSKAGHLLQIL